VFSIVTVDDQSTEIPTASASPAETVIRVERMAKEIEDDERAEYGKRDRDP